MIMYVVNTSLGLVLFDDKLTSISPETVQGEELPPFTIHVDERHLFTAEDIEEHTLTSVLDASFISTVREYLCSKMIRNASEILINMESNRVRLPYYSKLKQPYPEINKAVLATIKKSEEKR